jgi:glutathione S-transferase
MKLYDSPVSGNCYKVRLLLSHLALDYERVEVDVTDRGERIERPRALNPTGRVPTLELDDGRHLGESNAILFHLAQGTPYLSDDPFERARTLQWMFFEQNHLEPSLAVARYIVTILGKADENREVLGHLRAGGTMALETLERRLRPGALSRGGGVDRAGGGAAAVRSDAALRPFRSTMRSAAVRERGHVG